jgi:hypothetical protein
MNQIKMGRVMGPEYESDVTMAVIDSYFERSFQLRVEGILVKGIMEIGLRLGRFDDPFIILNPIAVDKVPPFALPETETSRLTQEGRTDHYQKDREKEARPSVTAIDRHKRFSHLKWTHYSEDPAAK